MDNAKKLDKNSDNYVVPALKRGLQILEMFSAKSRVLSINDFADGLGMSPSAIYRTVVTLTELGYLKKLERNSYELGHMVLNNGFRYLASREIVEIAAPYLHELRDKTSSACHLVIREGIYAIYLYRALSPQRMAVNVPIGTRYPCHTAATGRALLTGVNENQLVELFAGVALEGYAPPAPTSLPQLLQMIATDRERGFSINRSDFATAIATPVHNYAGEVVASINISGPDTLMGEESVRNTMTSLLIETAARISAEVGGRKNFE